MVLLGCNAPDTEPVPTVQADIPGQVVLVDLWFLILDSRENAHL